jgi:lactoylglutathione lyase
MECWRVRLLCVAHTPSLAIGVNDPDTMRAEMGGRGLDLGGIRMDEWGGKQYRMFFLREAENGYCFCFTQPVPEG